MCRVLTLLYHRVTNLDYDKNLLAVTQDNFYEQMACLKKNYPIVRYEQDWNQLDNDAVCITFDDGYMDNFTEAVPILRELDIPATIFVATANINTSEEFWWDELERLLLDKEHNYCDTFKLEDDLFSCQWSTETFSEREELYDTLHWLMYNKITVNKRKNWMNQLREWKQTGSVGRMQNRALQVDKTDLQDPLLTIGAHTVNHPSLRSLSYQEQYYEISRSIKDLEALLKRKIDVFSYPFGSEQDYDRTTIEICKELQIQKAAANIPGLWIPQSDKYQTPRNIVRNWDVREYMRKIESFWRLE